MIEVRREDDGELCGFVVEADGGWRATTVFGATLGERDTLDEAVELVLTDGLASLMDRWQLRHGDGEAEVVCIQEADPGGVTVALDYSSLPGVPTLRITRAQLDAGELELFR